MSKPEPDQRDRYRYFVPITTRWMDNDIYGHVNNVTYYSYFDTVANQFLIEEGGLDIVNDSVVGYVVQSNCNYQTGIAYPDKIEAGLRVDKLGQRSVQYGIAIFKQGQDQAVAQGQFTHVFVDRAQNRSVPIPDKIRQALSRIESS